jgi:hypothetical protein
LKRVACCAPVPGQGRLRGPYGARLRGTSSRAASIVIVVRERPRRPDPVSCGWVTAGYAGLFAGGRASTDAARCAPPISRVPRRRRDNRRHGCSGLPSAPARPRPPPVPPLRVTRETTGTRSVVPGTRRNAGALRNGVPCASGGDRRPRYEHHGHLGCPAACVSTLRGAPRPALMQAVRLAARPTAPGR